MASSNRRGFTLIELLIVVVIIGVLAAIAIPKFQNTKEKAFVGTMKSDLRNLAVAEEAYLYENAVYTMSLIALQFTASSGVALTINEATPAGWSATATHVQTPVACYVFVGAAAPVGTATQEGIISCS